MVPREMTLNDVPAVASRVAFWILGTKTLQVRLLQSTVHHLFCLLLLKLTKNGSDDIDFGRRVLRHLFVKCLTVGKEGRKLWFWPRWA